MTTPSLTRDAPPNYVTDALPNAVAEFRDAARRMFGTRLATIVVYGSRARGDHRSDSDWDIALFVEGATNTYTEYAPLAQLAGQILRDYDVEINACLLPANAWSENDTPLLRNIRKEGLAL